MSWTKIKPEQFENEMKKILNTNKEEIVAAVNQIALDESKATVNELRKDSKGAFGKGSYQKGWTKRYKKIKEGYKTYTVYNKSRYMLTHLLENGHVKVLWGHRTTERVEGKEHIRPVAEKHEKAYYEEVVKRLKQL